MPVSKAAPPSCHSRAPPPCRYYGENLNSTPSDIEFWAALSSFVDKFSASQKAIITVGSVLNSAALASPPCSEVCAS